MDLKDEPGSDPEIAAISVVYNAIKALDPQARERVLDYVAAKFGIAAPGTLQGRPSESLPSDTGAPVWKDVAPPSEFQDDGISPVAKKWLQRSNLTTSSLAKVFSVGSDEIDLIATSVPGKSKKTRTLNVALLKALASYLATGATRVTHQQIKETCLHYDAYDGPNFARYLKESSAEITGAKESGYTLTQRGLAAATELVRQMIHGGNDGT